MPDIQLIHGKKIAQDLLNDLSAQIDRLAESPVLAVILIGDHPASRIYVRAKQRAAKHIGIQTILHERPSDATQNDILNLIDQLNQDDQVHGILVQLPLPAHIDRRTVINALAPHKDVDGLHPLNIGRLILQDPAALVPCTPLGCLHLIKSVKPDLTGLTATVVGASHLVGRPMAQLLINERCTVIQAQSQTRDLVAACQHSDILVIATGATEHITADHVKDGAVLIDVGITRRGDQKIVGDIHFHDVTSKRNCAITPVPGGVGPMTIAMLMHNTLQAASRLI